MGLALVTRIPSLVEAQIAAGALRSAGIDAQVFDAAFGAMESPVIEQLGGLRIMAPEEQLAAARDALNLLRASPGLGEPDELGPWATQARDAARTRGRGMRLVAFLLLSAPFLLWMVVRLAGWLAPPEIGP
ncbi:MAG TPA: DUF2007 domain-containing protein [Caulobacteraceae bacterium]|nr:DUF2007 domain-containing protein [Caulobacteraceae bacterium]